MNTNTQTNPSPKFFLGIDVGSKDLFCHILGPDLPASERFDNNPAGIKRLIQWLKKISPPAQPSRPA